ncbi:MAG: glycine cleavage system aminomethyltransferase GcvT [Tissierellia bacterium]|nr:glycine cleavage system aminomethyltransferase GcvT [Tissierellia bacterium]
MDAKKTAIYDCHVKLGGNMVEYAGWLLPSEFTGLVEEHNAVRNDVGIFDVSHMGEFLITGPDATKFTNYVLSNNLDKIGDGQCQYTIMLNENGGVVDDLLVSKYNPEKIFWVVNGANAEKDFAWIQSKKGDFDVVLENVSPNYSEIAIQGPKSQELLQKVVNIDLDELEYYHFVDGVEFDGKKVLLSRTGYTGEHGYEVYCDWEDGPEIWDKLVELGATPCGLGCRDTLRFEASMPLFGNEIDEDMGPLEAGLKFCCDMTKDDFIGKAALEKQLAEGVKRKLIGLELTGKGIPRHGYAVLKDGKEIGHITTGYLAPTVGKPIANVIIDAEEAVIGNEVEVQIRKKVVPAKLISKKYLAKK